MAHPLIEQILTYLPTAREFIEANPFARKHRAGWFGCSDLDDKPGSDITFQPGRVLRSFLGLPDGKLWDQGSSWCRDLGTAIDALVGGALKQIQLHRGMVQGTQLDLQNPACPNLRGTPDMLLDLAGRSIYCDLKSTSPRLHAEWTSDGWDVSRAYFWRQLQAYLWLAEADRGLILFVDRSSFDLDASGRPRFGRDLEAMFEMVPFRRDDLCIQKLRDDLDRLNSYLPGVLQAAAPDRTPEQTIRRLRDDPTHLHHLLAQYPPFGLSPALMVALPPETRATKRRSA